MHVVLEWAFFGLCAALLFWVLEMVISDAVAKGIAKSGVVNLDVQSQIEDGVRDALESYFVKRDDE